MLTFSEYGILSQGLELVKVMRDPKNPDMVARIFHDAANKKYVAKFFMDNKYLGEKEDEVEGYESMNDRLLPASGAQSEVEMHVANRFHAYEQERELS